MTADVDAAVRAEPPGVVRLLPAFDQYVVASTRQADHLLPGLRRARVYRPQGWLSPVLLIDGLMAGVWKHERKGARLAVTIEPFARVERRARQATEAEAAELGRFFGAEPEVTWTT
jgi:Winged helix DNA-binding domain